MAINITEEELALLDDTTREKIMELAQGYQSGQQTQTELRDFMTKVYANPEVKSQLEQLVAKVDPNIQIPKTPLDNYVAPLKQELEQLKMEQAKKEITVRLQAKARQLNIRPEEAAAVEKFIVDNGIMEYEKGLELYAASRNQSLNTSVTDGDILSSTFKKNSQVYDLETAKQRAVDKIRNIRGF